MKIIADSPLPALPRCDDRTFLQCFRILHAALPKRASDELSGELLIATYQRMLGHLPKEAIGFLAEQALSTCRWFPTVAECMDIVGRWRRADDAAQRQGKASFLARHEMQARMDEAMNALSQREMSQAQIDALPERWKRIASERCYLWRDADGSFRVRPEPGSAARADARAESVSDAAPALSREDAAKLAEEAHRASCGGMWEELSGGHRKCDGCGAFQRWEADGWFSLPASAYETWLGRELDDAPKAAQDFAGVSNPTTPERCCG